MNRAQLKQQLSYFGDGNLEKAGELFKDIVEQAATCKPVGDLPTHREAEALRDTLKEMLVEIDVLFCKRTGTEGFGFREEEEWRHRYGEIKHALGLLEGRFDFNTP